MSSRAREPDLALTFAFCACGHGKKGEHGGEQKEGAPRERRHRGDLTVHVSCIE
jgi:hypothetical protein